MIYRDGAPTLTGYFRTSLISTWPASRCCAVHRARSPVESAAGGALFIRTNSPELGEFGGNVEVGGGDHEQAEITGAINVPLTDTIAMRFAAHTSSATTTTTT